MTILSSYPASTFGSIYHQAFQSQLQRIGNTLRLLRQSRREETEVVAAAVNLRPEILERIENGQHNFRLKTLLALAEYYNIDAEMVIGKGELLHFKLT